MTHLSHESICLQLQEKSMFGLELGMMTEFEEMLTLLLPGLLMQTWEFQSYLHLILG